MKYILLSLMLAATSVPTASPTPSLVNTSVTPAGVAMLVGTTLQMQFSEIFSDETIKVTTPSEWTSTSPKVATVNNTGLVTAVAAGTTSISATYSGHTARTTVSVYTSGQLKK